MDMYNLLTETPSPTPSTSTTDTTTPDAVHN